MRAKHLFWVISLAVLVFALFPQGSAVEDEMGWKYEHPFPGFWILLEEFRADGDSEWTYRAQLVTIHWNREHMLPDSMDPNGAIIRNLYVVTGWRLDGYKEVPVIAYFTAGSSTIVKSLHFDWYLLPDWGDPPWRPPVIQTHFRVWTYADDPGGRYQQFRTEVFSLNSPSDGVEADDCPGAIYRTRRLEDNYSRWSTGCFFYPRHDPRFGGSSS